MKIKTEQKKLVINITPGSGQTGAMQCVYYSCNYMRGSEKHNGVCDQ